MGSTTLSAREFINDVRGARKAAKHGPVFITDRGHPTHVLLSIEQYTKLTKEQPTIVELLQMPDGNAARFNPPRLRDGLRRQVDPA